MNSNIDHSQIRWKKLSEKTYVKKANEQFLELVIGEQTTEPPTVRMKGRTPMSYIDWENMMRDPQQRIYYPYMETKIVANYKWEIYIAYYRHGMNFHIDSIKSWSDIMGYGTDRSRPMMTSFGKYDSCSLAKKIADAGVIGLYNYNQENMMYRFQ